MSVNSKNSQISAYERHCNEIKTPFASQCLLAVIKKRITRTLKKIYISSYENEKEWCFVYEKAQLENCLKL